MASCDTEQVLQVWKISEDFFFNEIDYMDRVEQLKDTDIE